MARINTEIRISHKTIEEKQEYEKKLDEALKAKGYKTRTEWLNEKYRELIKGDIKMKNIYVVGTMKAILTLDDMEDIAVYENETEVKEEHNKYHVYVEDGTDVNNDVQYRYLTTKLN